ncbi:uncharacterized protein LOC122089237 [Macadamia integrifolia]|uniref:uncharacterized protein LOC122089237 n=1 Tax=Macadamia integrifolia TaxID=60698 RepID=UPI001C4F30B0|nr:uncharacterized protein LOC122089237 [Macadamia integrifolia]
MGVCVEPSESESTRFFCQLCDLGELKIGSSVLPFQNLPSMPSVGMRLSTRVFVPKSVVQAADGGRVLRSGKRLWSESDDGRPGQGSEAEVWFKLLDHSGDADDVLYCKDNGWNNIVAEKGVALKLLDREMAPESMNRPGASTTDESVDKMYGNVYHRKRQRSGANQSFASSFPSEDGGRISEDRMYGIPFVRKQRGKRPTESPTTALSGEMEVVDDNEEHQVLPCKFGFLQQDVLNGIFHQAMVFVVTKPLFSSTSRFACLLNSILSYMMRSRVQLSDLTDFLSAKPIAQAFSLNGIHLLHEDNPCSINRKNDVLESGICKIFEASGFTPLFSLDFLSVPCAFMYLHSRKHLGYLPNVLLRYLMGLYTKARRFSNSQRFLSCIPLRIGLSGSKIMTSGSNSIGKKEVAFIGTDPKSAGGGASRRHGLNRHSIQKKSRLVSGRGINLSIAELQSSCNVVGLLCSMNECSLPVSNRKHRRSMSDGLGENIKDLKSTLVELRQNIDSLSCSANLLVIEPDKCYREEGAEVSLELSTSNEWLIAARRQGSLRYCVKAQNVMRPSTSNRFTHAMIWAGVNGWKLEFTDRREWLIFKELHKECYDRNMQTPSVRILPVPGVHEVQGDGGSKCTPFVQPERYITMKEDEVARALMRTTANYDIQSDDEEFLTNLNNEFYCGDNVGSERISADNFEKIIDTFEKTAYCSPDDVADENKAVNLCLNLGRTEVLVAIYNHWVKKRKLKRSTLIRVFQCHPPRRAQLIQKPFLRKKRSFKRKGSQYGRGKQPRFLQAMAEEHDVMAARQRFEEAKSSARSSLEVAMLKRRRAQILMENADLATYKATIALRLAEAIQRSELRATATATSITTATATATATTTDIASAIATDTATATATTSFIE